MKIPLLWTNASLNVVCYQINGNFWYLVSRDLIFDTFPTLQS